MSLQMFASVLGIGIGVVLFVAYQFYNSTPNRPQTYENTSSKSESPHQYDNSSSARRRRTDNSNEKNDCIICLESFSNSKIEVFTACCHKFHQECLNNWKSYSSLCPMCRRPL